MAKKRKIPPKDWAAYDERTRLIEERIAELGRQIEEDKKRASRARRS